MRKRKIGVLEWESKVNTISITEQNNKHLDVLNSDSLCSMKDTERELKEIADIQQRCDRAYYVKTKK